MWVIRLTALRRDDMMCDDVFLNGWPRMAKSIRAEELCGGSVSRQEKIESMSSCVICEEIFEAGGCKWERRRLGAR